MKRTAAIIGPTPAFIRWAINLPCELREIDTSNLPASTFRQLRAIKELDLARREQRIFQDVAFHVDVQAGHDLIGFLPAEILAASGGVSTIENACLNCQANIDRNTQGWAGCFGIARLPDANWVSEFDEVIRQPELNHEFSRLFGAMQPAWFRVWLTRIIDFPKLEILSSTFSKLDWGSEWRNFQMALEICALKQLELHVEYFPAGNSDGLHWRLNAHCEYCKQEFVAAEKECGCCGRARVAQAVRKRKVLGLRPYMQLKYVLGEKRCDQLTEDYLNWKTQADS